jgi:glycosyltransferase involved in cell wall biosynthesis
VIKDARRQVDTLPSVSVLMAAYNHERFIEQAVESVFMQQYGGTITLFVSDDCSSDATPAKLQDLARYAPIPVDLVLRSRNVGGLPNLRSMWTRATGKYVALLEGDDYWTSPTKIARQVAALEARAAATMSFGRAMLLDETVDPPVHRLSTVRVVTCPSLADLLQENIVDTPTVLYRRGIVPDFPDWFESCPVRDWPLHALHAARGDLVYMDDVLATVRLHSGGRWTGTDFADRARQSVDVHYWLWREVGIPDGQTLRRCRAHDLASLSGSAANRSEGFRLLARACRLRPAVIREGAFVFGTVRLVFGDAVARRFLRAANRVRGVPNAHGPR